MKAFQQFCKSYLFLASFLIPAIGLAADNYPNKPIRLIVPFEAGGTSDTTARMMAQMMAELMVQMMG